MEPVSPGSHRREKCATRTVHVMLVRTNYCKKMVGVDIRLDYSLRKMMRIAYAHAIVQLSNEARCHARPIQYM